MSIARLIMNDICLFICNKYIQITDDINWWNIIYVEYSHIYKTIISRYVRRNFLFFLHKTAIYKVEIFIFKEYLKIISSSHLCLTDYLHNCMFNAVQNNTWKDILSELLPELQNPQYVSETSNHHCNRKFSDYENYIYAKTMIFLTFSGSRTEYLYQSRFTYLIDPRYQSKRSFPTSTIYLSPHPSAMYIHACALTHIDTHTHTLSMLKKRVAEGTRNQTNRLWQTASVHLLRSPCYSPRKTRAREITTSRIPRSRILIPRLLLYLPVRIFSFPPVSATRSARLPQSSNNVAVLRSSTSSRRAVSALTCFPVPLSLVSTSAPSSPPPSTDLCLDHSNETPTSVLTLMGVAQCNRAYCTLSAYRSSLLVLSNYTQWPVNNDVASLYPLRYIVAKREGISSDRL